jgi:glycosyltransferase involved in cell wall biosynthesis
MARLGFVVNNPDFLVSHRLVLVRGARAAGHEVVVIAPEGAGRGVLEGLGCTFQPWPLERGGQQPLREAWALASLVAAYRRHRLELVHHVTIKPVLYGSLAARVVGVPAVVNAVSGLGYVFISRGPVARLRREAVRRAYWLALTTPNSRVVLQNDDDERSLQELGVLGGARVEKIRGSGVDLAVFQPAPIPAGTPLVVLPARLLRDKGVTEFVDAARLLRQQGVGARFAVVGGEDAGNPSAIEARQLARWKAEGVVEWWGHRTDMAQVLARATVVCLPSYREGMPKALLEAAAVGRAIVTTDVPGCRDAVAGGAIGLLVPARTVEPLAAALAKLIRDPLEASRLGAAAQEHARLHFSDQSVLSSHLRIYEELLHSRG